MRYSDGCHADHEHHHHNGQCGKPVHFFPLFSFFSSATSRVSEGDAGVLLTTIVIETPAQRPSVVRSQQASNCQCFHTARSYGSLVRSPLRFVETPSNTDATVPWCVGVETAGMRCFVGSILRHFSERRGLDYAPRCRVTIPAFCSRLSALSRPWRTSEPRGPVSFSNVSGAPLVTSRGGGRTLPEALLSGLLLTLPRRQSNARSA